MPLVLSCVAQKGGAGKTTLALNLADAFMNEAGQRVLVVDADPQGSLRIWADVAAERDVRAPTVVGVNGGSIRKTVGDLAESFDVIIIDTPPRMGREAEQAVAVSHLTLVPVAPGPADIWALSQTVDTLKHVESMRASDPVLARVVLNRVDSRTGIGANLAADAATSGLAVLQASLGNRVAFPEAMAGGQGVISYAPSTPAADEVRDLAREVLALLGGKPKKKGGR